MSEERFCDDWSCPEKFKCAHHFVQSEDYWAMATPDKPKTFFRGWRNRWGCVNFQRAPFNKHINEALKAKGDSQRPTMPDDYNGPRIVR